MRRANRHDGFSLVEVMVALVVVSIGLLGIAKMQALALSSTGTAKMRSLAAIEAASLASTLRADRSYWSAIAANLDVNVSTTGTIGTVTSAQDPTLNSTAPTTNCRSAAAPCTSAQVAAQDLNDWAQTLASVLPAGTAVVNCSVDATNANPVTCRIRLNWNENVVALNTATSATATAAQNQAALALISPTQYVLYVQP